MRSLLLLPLSCSPSVRGKAGRGVVEERTLVVGRRPSFSGAFPTSSVLGWVASRPSPRSSPDLASSGLVPFWLDRAGSSPDLALIGPCPTSPRKAGSPADLAQPSGIWME